jgi:hypothetical protein
MNQCISRVFGSSLRYHGPTTPSEALQYASPRPEKKNVEPEVLQGTSTLSMYQSAYTRVVQKIFAKYV